MLSICIPIYNFDVTTLVKSLIKEKSQLDDVVEILLIDDGSTIHKEKNKELASACSYLELKTNIGRSKIRNLFTNYAKQPYLLFLDCDSLLTSSNFIANYLNEIKKGVLICCGGRIYPEQCPSIHQRLSWKYGIISESKSAAIRSQNPNSSFMTNNFSIQKALFNTIKFDERLTKYGHEDTLFGYELKKHQVSIVHIQNPILNGALETNEIFLQKTELAIQNLMLILNFIDDDLNFYKDIHLLRTYLIVKPFRSVFLILVKIYNPIIRFLILRGIVNIHLYNLYKLGVLLSIKKSR
jgi:glycosyltransferase involved in cell wall biosynthesis